MRRRKTEALEPVAMSAKTGAAAVSD